MNTAIVKKTFKCTVDLHFNQPVDRLRVYIVYPFFSLTSTRTGRTALI